MIVDASVAVKWLLPETDSDHALALIGDEEMVVPHLLHAEVANAIRKKAQRGEIVADEVIAQLPIIARLTRTIDDSAYAQRAAEMAVELAHPVYDCLYLAIAEHLHDVVVTVDRKFLNALADTPYSARIRHLVTQ